MLPVALDLETAARRGAHHAPFRGWPWRHQQTADDDHQFALC
jgi:hypothetical protein